VEEEEPLKYLTDKEELQAWRECIELKDKRKLKQENTWRNASQKTKNKVLGNRWRRKRNMKEEGRKRTEERMGLMGKKPVRMNWEEKRRDRR
jgi:hypothetical protein